MMVLKKKKEKIKKKKKSDVYSLMNSYFSHFLRKWIVILMKELFLIIDSYQIKEPIFYFKGLFYKSNEP
jgi:hypothetical protein